MSDKASDFFLLLLTYLASLMPLPSDNVSDGVMFLGCFIHSSGLIQALRLYCTLCIAMPKG